MKTPRQTTTLHIDVDPSWAGGQRQVYLLLSSLDRASHHLLCPDKSLLAEKSRKAGITVFPFSGLVGFLLKPGRFRSYVVVHCHSSSSLNYGIVLKLLFGARLVYTKRVYDVRGNFLSRIKFGLCDSIVAISRFVARRLEEGGIPRKTIIVIHSASRLEKLSEKKGEYRRRFGDRKKSIVGSIGKLSGHKNHAVLVEAATELSKTRDDFLVLILGDGYLRRKLERLAKDRGVEKFVRFLGYRKDAGAFFGVFDLFVFPSKEEALGTSVLDAMLNRIPVITSRGPALPEMVSPGRTGLLFDPLDPKDLAEKIACLLDNPGLGSKLARNAYKNVRLNFSVEKMAESYRSLYRRLLSTPRRK